MTTVNNIPVDSGALVTGGAGFIGSHLVEELVRTGVRVSVLDDLSTGSRDNLLAVIKDIRFVAGDVAEVLQQGDVNVADYDYIFHLAANSYIPPSVKEPVRDYKCNLKNTFELLEHLRPLGARGPRVVNTSTAGVYGNPANLPIKEGDPTVPISPYGVSKLAAERYASVYSTLYGIRATSLRLFSVFGPRQHKQVVYDFMRKLDSDPTRLEVLGNGGQVRDFAYVTDVVQAMLLVATAAPGAGEVYNVASGRSCAIGELARMVCDVRGVDADIEFTGSVRPGDADRWVVDITRLEQLGFRNRVPLERGVRQISRWYNSLRHDAGGPHCE